MKLIAGLGNPGPRYADSRHNVGFLVVDELGRRWNCEVGKFDRHFEGLVGQTRRNGEDVLLLKPATFMNLSGQSVSAAARFYKLAPEQVLVVIDDLDLATGQLRLRAEGSAGGHKGLADILRHLGTTEVPRVRIGIGRVHKDATVEYVLGRFSPVERPAMEAAIQLAGDAVEMWLARGMTAAMNEFNRKPESDAQRKADRNANRKPDGPPAGATE